MAGVRLTRRGWLSTLGAAAAPVGRATPRSRATVQLVARADGGYGRASGPLLVSGRELTVRDVDFRPLELGGGTGRSIRFRSLPDGDELTFHPDSGVGPVDVERVLVDGRRSFDDELHAFGPGEARFHTVPGRWEGPSLFTRTGFATVEVELLDAGGAVASAAGPVTLATVYPWILRTVGETAQITRHPDVDPDWHAEFTIDAPGDSTVRPSWVLDPQPGADQFLVDLSHLGLPDGAYDWELRLLPTADATITETILHLSPVGDWGYVHVGEGPGVAPVAGLCAVALGGASLYARYARDTGAVDLDPAPRR